MNDMMAGGTSMSKTEYEDYNLIEEMTLNNYQSSNKRGQPKRVGGKFDADTFTPLIVKVDGMTQRLDRYGSYDHVSVNSQVGNLFAPPSIEHVAYVNNFQPRLNHDP